ncbi:TPA: type II toxin-antitoxin system death-on-curing family toxin [Campylobacter jejuni]|uniref:type II toxin-antitoxin system death-on-curing family toxin n=1 Tax=Campylobacter TaxID=194 RepID=UPI000AB41D4A|nr:type II toxin-antitoxin system death-on-curing family toxin [Campylobacter jejuni]HEQ3581089.1 type II toxin-antitoxin system death-on-curing family toxin [Campylobacter coli]EHM2680013.1 type II toxin-antitoxin system death-on-curing family toxin [Campylobacter jejuni]EIA9980995.1 type II toxin-antitoxin system death-on-curing family toxin [Campylobacter jejuni]EID3794280.1 type II toxin-antitoxin system death-on-curing family toxin [Campylobacter jejuni]EIE0706388.1 type II toxin-antitoxi
MTAQEINYISFDEILSLHDEIIENIGGLKGYNDKQIGLLKSALEHMQNDDYYPSFYEKLTHLIFACVKFHPFLDGNKRTAIYSAVYFIRLNKQDEVKEFIVKMEQVVVDLAENKIDKEKLLKLLQEII